MFLSSVQIDCLWGICIIISSILNNMRIKVKVGFIEGAEEWQINFFLRRFQKIDGSVLEFEIDKERADFLIAFPWLYTSSRENYLQFLEESRGKIVIMDVLGEALAPNLNLFDYHIGFDAPDDDGRLLCMSYLFDLRMKLKDLHTMNPDDALCGKDGFCNYIYSHGLGHPYRIQLFSELSAYKKVDAIGKHLNNTPCLIPREAEDWLAGSVLLKKPYKFSIACENSWYRRYTTEKIITSFLACTVPVYWGNFPGFKEYGDYSLLFVSCLLLCGGKPGSHFDGRGKKEAGSSSWQGWRNRLLEEVIPIRCCSAC